MFLLWDTAASPLLMAVLTSDRLIELKSQLKAIHESRGMKNVSITKEKDVISVKYDGGRDYTYRLEQIEPNTWLQART